MNPLAKLSTNTMQALPRLRLAINFVLVVVLALFVARVLWIIIDHSGAVSRPLPQFAMSQSSAAAPLSLRGDTPLLTQVNRFARADGQAIGPDLLPDAPATSLNLSLKGVRALAANTGGEPTDGAIAIIQTPDDKALTYHPGDTIIDGVTLDRVLPDRVLLRKGGALETLMMDSNADTLAVLSLPGQDGMIEGGARPAVVAATPAKIDRALLASLSVSPVVEEGNIVGYRLTNPGATSALAGTGLESGDILTMLDGTPVRDIDMQSITERLARSPEISLTVKRGNADVPVTLRFPEGE